MSESILAIRNLKKTFRSHWTFRPIQALENVSLTVRRGEAFGFLGHNGAGKTTTIKCIVGLIRATGGEILFDGQPMRSARQRSRIGYLPEHPYFYDHLTVRETLEFLASLHELSAADLKKQVSETLDLVGLGARAKSPVRTLSKGLQQRLGLAQAIVNKPALLLLDEPFSGLDPVGRIDVRNLIQSLRSGGTTIFMSSHILPDVENICDRVVIMANGVVRAEFELHSMSELYGEKFELAIWDLEHNSGAARDVTARSVSCQTKALPHGVLSTLLFQDRLEAQRALAHAAAAGFKIYSFYSSSRSLEEIFIEVTRDAAASKQTDWNGAACEGTL